MTTPRPYAELAAQQSVTDALVTLPDDIERMAVNRYRPVPAGVLAYKVVGGDGDRSLFSGTKDECQIVARKLTEAFLDGAHVALAATIDNLRTQLAEAQKDAEVSTQINRACAELPDAFRISIEIERYSGLVFLLEEDVNVDFNDPCEDVASSISAAINAAKGGSNA